MRVKHLKSVVQNDLGARTLNVQNLVEGMRLLIAQPVTLMVTIRLLHSRLPQRHVVEEVTHSLLDKIS